MFFIRSSMKKLAFLVMPLLIWGCSDNITNQNLSEEQLNSLLDSLKIAAYDSIYPEVYSDLDSSKQAFLDSLKTAAYDSIYPELYDSIYNDIYTQSTIHSLSASVYIIKEDIYTAFANQYPLMYKDAGYPISVDVKNNCSSSSWIEVSSLTQDYSSYALSSSCSAKKVVVKTWVDGFSDTTSVTQTVSNSSSTRFSPTIHFLPEKYIPLTAPVQTHFQIRAYALENDREILFFSSSEPTTIHPMQINGAEYTIVENRNWWWGVWVTPGMDSLQNILDDLSKKLPDGTVKVYQKYSDDKSIAQSSSRIVKAVFEVLQARGIHYIQNESAGSNGQKIKYPIEVLRTRGGLCIETTVLFASILEALGMQTFIVSVPGHTFVGWRTEKDSNTLDFVETTLIDHETSTYKYANNSAIERYNEEVDAGTFESGESELIDIEKVRKYGIMPNDIP